MRVADDEAPAAKRSCTVPLSRQLTKEQHKIPLAAFARAQPSRASGSTPPPVPSRGLAAHSKTLTLSRREARRQARYEYSRLMQGVQQPRLRTQADSGNPGMATSLVGWLQPRAIGTLRTTSGPGSMGDPSTTVRRAPTPGGTESHHGPRNQEKMRSSERSDDGAMAQGNGSEEVPSAPPPQDPPLPLPPPEPPPSNPWASPAARPPPLCRPCGRR